MPRLFRESPLNAIWEGSGNVIALDFLRAAYKEPSSLDAFFDELDRYSAANDSVRRSIAAAKTAVANSNAPDSKARMIVETMAKAWAGALIARHEDQDLLDAYTSSRLDGNHGSLFGTLDPGLPVDELARRSVPSVDVR